MKMLNLRIVSLLVAALVASSVGAVGNDDSTLSSSTLPLDGAWTVTPLPLDASYHLFTLTNGERIPAGVPGDIHLDLMRTGRMQDPDIGDNARTRCRRPESNSWWYAREFVIVAQRELARAKPALSKKVRADAMLEISSPVYRHGVHLDDGGSQTLEDNYFDLLPGITRHIRVLKPAPSGAYPLAAIPPIAKNSLTRWRPARARMSLAFLADSIGQRRNEVAFALDKLSGHMIGQAKAFRNGRLRASVEKHHANAQDVARPCHVDVGVDRRGRFVDPCSLAVMAGAVFAQMHDDGFRAPVSQALEGGIQIWRVRKLRQFPNIAVNQIDPGQRRANGFFALLDFAGEGVAPVRVPVKVQRNVQARQTRGAEKLLIAFAKHRA
jgi:hypothetical protein